MDIEPKTLVFDEPLNEVRTVPLVLTNKSSTSLVYKVKTTSPKTYCVRPNASVVPPGETIEVSITRQAHSTQEQSKDKFLILSAKVDPTQLGEKPDLHEVWQQLEHGEKSAIESTRIKVRFNFDESTSSGASAAHTDAGAAAVTGAPPTPPEKATAPTPAVSQPHFAGITGAPDYGSQTADDSVGARGVTDESAAADYTAHSFTADDSSNTSRNTEDLSKIPGVPAKSELVAQGDAKTGPVLSRHSSSGSNLGGRHSQSNSIDKGPDSLGSTPKELKKAEGSNEPQQTKNSVPEESEGLETGVAAAALGAVAGLGASSQGGINLDNVGGNKNVSDRKHVAGDVPGGKPPGSGPEHVGGKQEHVGGKQEHAGGKQEHTGGKQEHTGGKQEHTGGKQEHTGGKQHAGGKQEHVGGKQAGEATKLSSEHVGGKQNPVEFSEKPTASGSSTGAGSDVRQRSSAVGSSVAAATQSATGGEMAAGVPLPIVAVIAFIAFLLGWKLF